MSDELQRWMGRVETKIDTLLDTHKEHEARIQSLEDDRNRAKGALIGVGMFSGGLGAFLAKVMGWH
ncbi:hemolysin xhlA [Caudoviricetes sp.]|nr:hemolysin xhlA [Caudoviricetes sp.]